MQVREAAGGRQTEGVACGPNKDLSCAVFAFLCFSASVKARLPHKDTNQPKKKKPKKKNGQSKQRMLKSSVKNTLCSSSKR